MKRKENASDKKNFSDSLILVLTNEADYEKAASLAKKLLDQKLACCISFQELESNYWWKEEITTSKEIKLVIKSKESNLDKLIKIIDEFHSYEVPEIIYFPVLSSYKFLDWALGVMN